MDESWKPIPGYGGHYEASTFGRIRVKNRVIRKKSRHGGVMLQLYKSHVLRPSKHSKWGHLVVTLGVDGKDFNVSVHTLVLLAFVGKKPEGCEACHTNGDPADNRPENLRWDTHKANNSDRWKHGRYASGEKHHMAKLSAETVGKIRSSGLKFGEVSRIFKISRSQAWRILRGKSWKN